MTQKKESTVDKDAKVAEAEKVLKESRRPDYKGDGVAVWLNLDKNKREYFAIKMVGHNTVYAFIPDYQTSSG